MAEQILTSSTLAGSPHSSKTADDLITGEALLDMGDLGQVELVKGEIVYLMPTGYLHGVIEATIAALLYLFVKKHNLGRILSGEVGIYTTRNPDTVRGIDVAYISHTRLEQAKSNSFLDVAPELIVEVISPDDRWSDLDDKLHEYFAIGVQRVWIVNPQRRQVHVYRSLTDITIFGKDDILTGEETLPGFEVPVVEIFEN